MTTSQKTAIPTPLPDHSSLQGRDLATFGFARVRDQAFEAVQSLWRRRQASGLTNKMLAAAIGRDAGWVSKNLSAPGNWTLRTIGELTQGLGGEVEISVTALEDPLERPSNYDAYSNISEQGNPNSSVSIGSRVLGGVETSPIHVKSIQLGAGAWE